MPPHRPLVLLLVVSAAAQAVTGADDNIAKLCEGNGYPKICVEMLKSMPESSTASPHRAAELACQYVSKEGTTVSSELDKAIGKPKAKGNVPCLMGVQHNLNGLVTEVAKAAPKKDFNGAKDLFIAMLYEPTGTEGCLDTNEPVIGKVMAYEKRLQVTLDLFKKATKK